MLCSTVNMKSASTLIFCRKMRPCGEVQRSDTGVAGVSVVRSAVHTAVAGGATVPTQPNWANCASAVRLGEKRRTGGDVLSLVWR